MVTRERKCTISRNMVFDEEKLYKEKKAEEVPKSKQQKNITFRTKLIQGPKNIVTVQSSSDRD